MLVVRILIVGALLSSSSIAGYSAIKNLEEKLLPFFNAKMCKSDQTSLKKRKIYTPTTKDLFLLAKQWSNLSEDFKMVYSEAISIPTDCEMYPSPGFGIEIYYKKHGLDAVDTTDVWGCSKSDWHMRDSIENGVPDYIDEIAWAMDSVWNMEVNRFAFKAPIPFTSSLYSSNNYKILVEEQSSGDYGLTYPVGPALPPATGFASIVTIRNNWDGWNVNQTIDYQTHPEKGIRITCAHEFFHAIQYGMVHEVADVIYLDDFPVSWLEGCAVMMEELAFSEVNDYTQYVNSLYDDPSMFTVFGNSTGMEMYANSLICLFLYNHSKNSPGIDFFKKIYDDNTAKKTSFGQLLDDASLYCGKTWGSLLCQFFTASFFTGSRAGTSKFIPDSKLLPQWSYFRGEYQVGKNIVKIVPPSGVQIVSFENNNITDSNLYCSGITTSSSKNIAINIICRFRNDTSGDSIITLSDNQGALECIFQKSNLVREYVVIITNGDRIASGIVNLSIGFHAGPVGAYRKMIAGDSNALPERYLLNGRKLTSGGKCLNSGLFIELSAGRNRKRIGSIK